MKRRNSAPSGEGFRRLDSDPRFEIYKRDGYLCHYCGVNILELSASGASLDHVYPESLGGLSVASNLITCCLACNRSKSHMLDVDQINKTLELIRKRNQVFLLNGNRKVRF